MPEPALLDDLLRLVRRVKPVGLKRDHQEFKVQVLALGQQLQGLERARPGVRLI